MRSGVADGVAVAVGVAAAVGLGLRIGVCVAVAVGVAVGAAAGAGVAVGVSVAVGGTSGDGWAHANTVQMHGRATHFMRVVMNPEVVPSTLVRVVSASLQIRSSTRLMR